MSEHLTKIQEFLEKSSGLKCGKMDKQELSILQVTDGKTLKLLGHEIEEVISRTDSESQPFLQVNFLSGKKILLTQTLIGFKPAPAVGLDMSKLPKVVTTPDLISVVEAIEDSPASEEVEVLKRVFDSVLRGAELVGFDLTSEKMWLHRNPTNKAHKASA